MLKGLHEALSGKLTVEETLCWFDSSYVPEILYRMNRTGTRKLLSLYNGERIPTNERNLTDTRNRIGLILEYELARISNEILNENRITDLFWSYTVANRFPDLEVHDNTGKTRMKVEVKALQSCAEEKSANFATLLKNINPNTDYLVVFLWEWDHGNLGPIKWDRSVKVQRMYVFHAYSLAKLRDAYWLNKPPTSCTAYQGFDLRYPVNNNRNGFNREEGNVGKILRLWKEGTDYPRQKNSLINQTINSYLKFQEEVINAGFDTVAKSISKSLCETEPYWEGRGYICQNFGIFQNTELPSKADRLSFVDDNDLTIAVGVSDKYKCQLYTYSIIEFGTDERKIDRPAKPKEITKRMTEYGLVVA